MALSRQEMERIIVQERGSVLYKGRIISRVEEIPSDAELAEGDPEREAAVRDALDAQIAALTAQRDRLGTPAAPTFASPPPRQSSTTGDVDQQGGAAATAGEQGGGGTSQATADSGGGSGGGTSRTRTSRSAGGEGEKADDKE